MSLFRDIALEKIEEAMREGVFDNLPGRGQPLDLSEDPNTPPHLRLGNRLLRDAGVVPEWMEVQREIEKLQEKRAKLWQNLKNAHAQRHAAPSHAASDQKYFTWRAASRAAYRQLLERINERILLLNLKAPSAARTQTPIQIDEEMQRFDAAFGA